MSGGEWTEPLLGALTVLASGIVGLSLRNSWALTEIRTAVCGVGKESNGGLIGEMQRQRDFKHEANNRLLAVEMGKVDKPGFPMAHSD